MKNCLFFESPSVRVATVSMTVSKQIEKSPNKENEISQLIVFLSVKCGERAFIH